MSAKEKYEQRLQTMRHNALPCLEIEDYVSELQADNEKLVKERDVWKQASESFERCMDKTIEENDRLRARIESSPKVWVAIFGEKGGHYTVHVSAIPNSVMLECYAVPVEADEK